MNFKKSKITVVFLLLSLLFFFAADSLSAASLFHYKQKIYESYVHDNMPQWKRVMQQMEKEKEQLSRPGFLLHLTITQYGYIGYLMGTDNKKEAKKLLEKTSKNAEKLLDTKYKAEAWAIKAGLNGYEIGLAKHKAPFLGKRSEKYTDKSLSLKTRNPMAWMEKGNIYYHMPGFFGGSYDKAIRYYTKAVGYYKHNSYLPRWLKLNAIVWLGKTYEADGKLEKAAQTYRRALRIEPDFHWVKTELMPGLKKKL